MSSLLFTTDTTTEMRQSQVAGFTFAAAYDGPAQDDVHQTLRTVIYKGYLAPPHGSVYLSEPLDLNMRFDGLEAWRQALHSKSGLWRPGSSTYLAANCRRFYGVPSVDPDNAAYRVPPPPSAPIAGPDDDPALPLEIDPGQVFLWTPQGDTPIGGAVKRVDGQATGGNLWIEFWALLPNYQAPSAENTVSWGPYPGGILGPVSSSAQDFLMFWAQDPAFQQDGTLIVKTVRDYGSQLPSST